MIAVKSNPKFFCTGYPGHDNLIMISNPVWWMDHEKSILNWLDLHIPTGRLVYGGGFVLEFKSPQHQTLFCLKWQ